MSLGEVAYNAYCNHRKWTGLRGGPLPAFIKQDPGCAEGWEIAAKAVLEEVGHDDLKKEIEEANSEITELEDRLAAVRSALDQEGRA